MSRRAAVLTRVHTDPKSLHLRREPWLLDFDQEAHTYAVFDETIAQMNEEESKKPQEPSKQDKAEDRTAPPPPQTTEATSEETLKTALPTVVQTELMGTA